VHPDAETVTVATASKDRTLRLFKVITDEISYLKPKVYFTSK